MTSPTHNLLLFFAFLISNSFATPVVTQPDAEPVSLFESFRPSQLGSDLKLDLAHFWKRVYPQESNASEYAAIIGLTMGLNRYDEDLSLGSRDVGYKLKVLHPEDSGQETKVFFKLTLDGRQFDLRSPRSPNAFFWFFGEGISALLVMGGLVTSGLIARSSYEVETASLIFKALVITGLHVFQLKLLTGRESPARSSTLGGRWQFYPGLSNYLNDQSRYYSFPSGHTATLVTTMTVLTQRYVESSWLKPLAYTLTGLLMFALVNNRTHWASDFPVAIGIGYNAAIAVSSPEEVDKSLQTRAGWQGFQPVVGEKRQLMLGTRWIF